MRKKFTIVGALLGLLLCCAPLAWGHGVAGQDAQYLERISGAQLAVFTYLGAKHMVTGYDHLLFLAAVIFFLYRLRDVALYVTLFAVGHSATLLLGVITAMRVNPYIVDAVIGLSVVYKALENLGALSTMGVRIDSRAAVFGFGLVHGLGLATKLQDLTLAQDGLVANLLAFNVGVELGQLAALVLLLLAFGLWRSTGRFERGSYATNVAIMTAGWVLTGCQLTGYMVA